MENERDFERLVEEHRTTILSVCYMFSKDEQEVADLFQETLVNIWNGMKMFQQKSDVRTWIYRVSLNTCLNIEKREKKHRANLPLEMQRNLFVPTDQMGQQIEMLYKRIHRLEVFDRALIMLWLENMSYEEMGLILGISPQNVGVRLYRIKENLKKMSD